LRRLITSITMLFFTTLRLHTSYRGRRTTKEPLVSKLTIPNASPLYHTGNNIFMKYNLVPNLKKLSPWQIFLKSNPIHA
jgi:hypothetical protein